MSETTAYVRHWFIRFDDLVRRAGGMADQIDALIAAGAAPGIVYSQEPAGDWWSALGGFVGKLPATPPAEGDHWYAPSALYWLRRGLLLLRAKHTAEESAIANRDAFRQQFIAALGMQDQAPANYPSAFDDNGNVDLAGATSLADAEWRGWTSGAYAVCLRSFTGQSCVAKESLARYLRTQFESGADRASDVELLDALERLSVWLMPFAPFERPGGTPGFAIDKVLAALRLGNDEPYAVFGRNAYAR